MTPGACYLCLQLLCLLHLLLGLLQLHLGRLGCRVSRHLPQGFLSFVQLLQHVGNVLRTHRLTGLLRRLIHVHRPEWAA